MDKKEKTKKKLKLSTQKTKSLPSNPHLISGNKVVVKLERLSDSVVAEMTACGSALPPEQTKKKLKLSTRKTKSHPSNPHLICSSKVMVQLERLSDSVVAEMTTCGSALPPEQVKASNDYALNINSFPDEIILEVFGYLKQNQLGKIARVCTRWNVLTKSPVLWKKVDVKLSPSYGSETTVAKSFLNGLPSCVMSIRLDFEEYRQTGPFDFAEFCVKLREKHPHIEECILSYTKLSHSLPVVIHLCMQFLQNVKKLVFNHCIFPDYSDYQEFCTFRYYKIRNFSGISKIEVLDLSGCALGCYSTPYFSRMLCLKVLCLRNTNVYLSWFQKDISFLNRLQVLDLGLVGITADIFEAIMHHGLNLKELYVCESYLRDSCLNLNNLVFPHLKTICLSLSGLTCEGVVSLIRSYPSLENVYVDEHVAETFAAHPFVASNTCKSGIVKFIDRIHKHNVNNSLIS